jgi:hypothetical protein
MVLVVSLRLASPHTKFSSWVVVLCLEALQDRGIALCQAQSPNTSSQCAWLSWNEHTEVLDEHSSMGGREDLPPSQQHF